MTNEDPVVDIKYMERCLILALQAEGRTSPNPVVGAVVLDSEGNVVGEGFHARAGQPHAEVMALQAAGEKARGGTIYVSLEPCCHHGKTGPCTEAVTASGVTRVVASVVDPNPKVGGGGIAALRAAGLTVDVGLLQEECSWANRAFITAVTKGRPWVCLKLATTLDGRIADRYGHSRWVSGPEARHHVQLLRNSFDCVLVGAGTARKDDPELSVREVENGRNPHRAVLDPQLSMHRDARMFQKRTDGSRTYLFCSKKPEHLQRLNNLPETVSVIRVREMEEDDKKGFLNLSDVMKALKAQEINSVLCEGGGTLAAELLSQRLVDEVHWIIAPRMINDTEAVPALNSRAEVLLDDALQLERVRISQLGSDVLFEGTVGRIDFSVS